MSTCAVQRGGLLALTGRDPADAIVQATLVQQLQTIGVAPAQVHVMHVVPGVATPEWFVFVERYASFGLVRRHTALLYAVIHRLRADPPAAIYAREVATVQLAFLARTLTRSRVKVIFDCRGDVVAEARLKQSSRFRILILAWLQKRAWRRADRVLTVSERLARDIGAVVPTADIRVVPNLQPHALEPAGGGALRPIVVFAGGGQAWQGSARVLTQLAELNSLGVDVEVITRDGELREAALSAGFEVSSGDRSHVMDRLQRATGSWMVRADVAANAVASPVKLGEALVAGALVIGSSSTWEHMGELESDGLAMQLRDGDNLEALAKVLHKVWREGSAGRARRLAKVEKRWTLEAYRGDLRWFYGRELLGCENEH